MREGSQNLNQNPWHQHPVGAKSKEKKKKKKYYNYTLSAVGEGKQYYGFCLL